MWIIVSPTQGEAEELARQDVTPVYDLESSGKEVRCPKVEQCESDACPREA